MSAVEQIPPGGWKYVEKRTNITLIASSRENLIQHLKSHRKSNGIEEGDIEKDIQEQINATQSAQTV